MTTKTAPKPPPKPKPTPEVFPHLNPDEASRDALREIAEFAKQRGMVQAIAAEMTRVSGCPVARQQVGKWLSYEVQPTLGNALLLLYVVEILKAPKDRARDLAADGKLTLRIVMRPEPDAPKAKKKGAK